MNQEELIKWQMHQIGAMGTKDALKALSYAYLYLKGDIDELKAKE